MRPGRLDRILYVGPPDLDSRKEIWEVRLRKMEQRDPEIDVDELGRLVSVDSTRIVSFSFELIHFL